MRCRLLSRFNSRQLSRGLSQGLCCARSPPPNEREVIRHNFGWTLFLLAYLIVIGIAFYVIDPHMMRLP